MMSVIEHTGGRYTPNGYPGVLSQNSSRRLIREHRVTIVGLKVLKTLHPLLKILIASSSFA